MTASSSSSTFTRSSIPLIPTKSTFPNKRSNMLMYESPTDPPNKGPDNGKSSDLWTVMANTERWISNTLAQAGNAAAATGRAGASNPYVRKEVSYVCDSSDKIDVVTAGIFSRLREMRETGENHVAEQAKRQGVEGSSYKPGTFRQTLVVVTPSNKDILDSFQVFDQLVQAINHARRNARDYVTDITTESNMDWSTTVNMAHLHPQYGILTPEETLAQEQKDDVDGEVDLNLQAYKEARLKARQSPHPTLVIEVRTTPAMAIPEEPQVMKNELPKEEGVSIEDMKKLEALFGKSATFEHEESAKRNKEDALWDAIGKTKGIKQISFETPLSMSQHWIMENVPDFKDETSSFAICDTKHVDSAYEFVFSNIAMHNSIGVESAKGTTNYLVMSNFLSSSATSFEKFSKEVENILNTMPGVGNKISVAILHPEHVDKDKRSPVPIFVLDWMK
eukprot:CAMPEP_0172513486 /NCGR_PEP_ID=MMETSP1066-20121228/252855_1 /TAXON_ID=671091 /ORGANISM="Coscinodiscus wailesii, Strain CCMP2513" /LENGTH=448 /DNA_ID=CAMNT_0013293773 /DNA_START=178 /DNA_END=1524 /DNA_ORIENTATION=+